MIPDIRTRARIAGLATGVALVLILPAAVFAHTELETASPTDGSTVPSPFDGPILLTFSEELADGSKADLLDPGGDVVASATIDGPEATMRFELESPLDPGDYEIEWTGVGVDGHVERDTLSFSVAPAPTPSPSPSPTPEATPSKAPASPSAAPTPAASPSPSPTPLETAPTSGIDVIIPIIAALLIVGVGGAYLLRRRGRPSI